MKLPKRKPTTWAKRIERRTPNKNSWLYQSRYWKSKRESFWTKPENQLCAMCNRPRCKGFTVDHKEPVPIGATLQEFIDFTEVNILQALCPKCNATKTAKDRWKN